MRIIHLADVHCGVDTHPGVKEAVLANIEAVVDRCMEDEIDAVIVAGDLFHRRNPVASDMAELFARLRDLPVVVVPGNHDSHKNGGALCLFPYDPLTEPKTYKVPLANGKKLSIHALPWQYGEYEPHWDPDPEAIFVGHCTVPGALTASLFPMMHDDCVMPLADLLSLEARYYALGHIHKHQEIAPRIVYAGSIARFNFTDEGQPRGYVVVDLPSGDYVFEALPGPNFRTIDVGTIGSTASLTESLVESYREEGGRGEILRVRGKRPVAVSLDFGPVEKRLLKAGALEVKWAIEPLIEKRARLDHVSTFEVDEAMADPLKALALYYEAKGKAIPEKVYEVAKTLVEEQNV